MTLIGESEEFEESSGTYTPKLNTGGTLIHSGSVWTYTKADGTVAIFNDVTLNCSATWCTPAVVDTITYPSGEMLTFTLRMNSDFIGIQSINSNLGYQIKINYGCASPSSAQCFITPSQVLAINNAVDYCDPAANSCASLTQSWPTLTYSATTSPAVVTWADAMSNPTDWSFSYNISTDVATYSLERPSGRRIDYLFHDWNDNPDAYKEVNDGANSTPWKYFLTPEPSSDLITGRVVDPLGRSRVIVADFLYGRPKSDTVDLGGLNLTTSYDYAYLTALPTKVTLPEGNYTQYTYDTRGNVTELRKVGKPSSGVADIVTTATYAGCNSTNFRHCNKPLTVTDPNGNTTTYTYSDDHGGVLTETGPIVAGGQPQTRYTYQAIYAWYKNSSGSIVQAATPVYQLTQVSKCSVGSGGGGGSGSNWGSVNWGAFAWGSSSGSCIGTADETRITNTYQSGSSSVASNISLLQVTTAAGNNSVTANNSMTYDIYGNVATATGPNSATSAYFYDLNRQQVGAISPDPDGGGSLNYPAVKTTYDTDTRATMVEQGTTTSQSSMSSFSSLLQKTRDYQNSYFAPVTLETSFVGGLSYPVAVTQSSYDQARNPECTAVRQNMSVLGSLPAACTLSTTGGNGQDQIKKNSYDAANRLTTVQRGVDSSTPITEVTNTYTANSQIDWLEDANGNRSDYTYNGQDRLIQLNFPSKTTAHTASSSDYEGYGYDANGNRTSLRVRSGETIGYTYDALNRQTVKDIPGGTSADVYSGYDLLSRLTFAHYGSTGGSGVDYTYDALSRKTSETSYSRTVTSQYDASGNRTHLIYPDSVDIEYTYDALNRMKDVKQSSTTLATYSYDNLGRVTGISRPNSTATSMSYSSTSQSWDLTQDMASTGQDVTFGLGFTPASQVSARTISNSAYAYSASALSRSYTPNGLNQYASVGGTSFTYDDRGNLTSDGSRSFAYDLENRLTGVSGSASMSLIYDPNGRMRETAASTTEQYLYDGDDLLVEYNTSGTILRRYVPGQSADENLVWYEGSNLSTPNWLQTDQQGSVIAASSNAGTATIYAYSPSGEPYGGWGSGVATPIFRYTGQAALPQIGVYYYKARIYDPVLGRFLQTDPIGYKDDYNLYAYVQNDPVNKVDPSGLGYVCLQSPGPGGASETCTVTPDPTNIDVPAVKQNASSNWLPGSQEATPGPTPENGTNRFCQINPVDSWFLNGLEGIGLAGDAIAIAGAYSGNPAPYFIGQGLSAVSTLGSMAVHYGQGDKVGIAIDAASFTAGLVPGGRIARRLGGASLDLGRRANGQFLPNWRGVQTAQDIGTEGLQQQAVEKSLSKARCAR